MGKYFRDQISPGEYIIYYINDNEVSQSLYFGLVLSCIDMYNFKVASFSLEEYNKTKLIDVKIHQALKVSCKKIENIQDFPADAIAQMQILKELNI